MFTRITEYEREALKEARPAFAEALEKHGLMEAFFNASPSAIDEIMWQAVEGFRIAMQRKNKLSDEIPF